VTVYLAWDGGHEDRDVVGIYATLEAAQAAHEHSEWSEDGLSCEWHKESVPAEPWPEMVFQVGVVHHYKAPHPGVPAQWCSYYIEEWTVAGP